jgi:carboxypeptidase C (cathepsin A)
MPRLSAARLSAARLSTICLAALLAATASRAADAPKPAHQDEFKGQVALLPADSVTHHSATFGGHPIAYTATAGTLTLRDGKGDPTARVFYVAYTADGADHARRPVSFFFNGGPGAGSAFLHLGAAGPMVLDFPADNPADGANATLVPNNDSWLPFTDMVFIDAIGTGYSRPVNPETAPKLFWGTRQDGDAFADAIRLWIDRNDRAASPKYLVGESYGGIRSIKVARALQEQQNILLKGIVMVSPAIELNLIGDSDNPVTDAIVLPSFAASSLELAHKFDTRRIDDAYRYAFGDYLEAIAGPPLSPDAANQFYAKLAGVSGLPQSVVAKERGRIDPQAHDVRSRDGRLYSLYDDTLSIEDPFPEGVDNGDSPDPVLSGYGRAYGNAFAGYAAQTLGFRTDLEYDLLNRAVGAAWNFKDGEQPVARGTPDLRKLLALNPALRILVTNGYFDTVCPFAGSRWLVEHLPIGRDRIQLAVYKGGHMFYTRPDSRAALNHDAAALYAATRNP